MSDLYHSKLTLGMEDAPYYRYFYATTTDPLEVKVFRDRIAPKDQKTDNFMTIEKGVENMRTNLFAFLSEDSRAYNIIEDTFLEHEKCDLVQVQFFKITYPFLV
jgi:glutamate receptor, ionotropic, invertebrate